MICRDLRLNRCDIWVQLFLVCAKPVLQFMRWWCLRCGGCGVGCGAVTMCVVVCCAVLVCVVLFGDVVLCVVRCGVALVCVVVCCCMCVRRSGNGCAVKW